MRDYLQLFVVDQKDFGCLGWFGVLQLPQYYCFKNAHIVVVHFVALILDCSQVLWWYGADDDNDGDVIWQDMIRHTMRYDHVMMKYSSGNNTVPLHFKMIHDNAVWWCYVRLCEGDVWWDYVSMIYDDVMWLCEFLVQCMSLPWLITTAVITELSSLFAKRCACLCHVRSSA